jgi:hypothetical protein
MLTTVIYFFEICGRTLDLEIALDNNIVMEEQVLFTFRSPHISRDVLTFALKGLIERFTVKFTILAQYLPE